MYFFVNSKIIRVRCHSRVSFFSVVFACACSSDMNHHSGIRLKINEGSFFNPPLMKNQGHFKLGLFGRQFALRNGMIWQAFLLCVALDFCEKVWIFADPFRRLPSDLLVTLVRSF